MKRKREEKREKRKGEGECGVFVGKSHFGQNL